MITSIRQAMSTFKGIFPSLPGISCDFFRGEAEKSDQFFISHCHSDHMTGLDTLVPLLYRRNSVRINHRLYCSMISKAFILRKFPSLSERIIKDLFPHEPCELNVFDKVSESFYKLKITALPSNHCPGSVMFLFEAHDKRILYTGDFRFENGMFRTFKPLHDAEGKSLPIDEMYLDTTFCHPGYKNFPSREESINQIWELVSRWIMKNGIYRKSRAKHVVFFQLPAQYGSERILKEMFERSGCRWRIHVSQKKCLDYLCSDELGDCTTSDPKVGEWIHACSWEDEEVKAHRFKKSHKEIPCANGLFEVRSIKPSALYFKMNEDEEIEYVKQTRKQTFRVCYSSHSSMKELIDFVKYFCPTQIIPCVDPPGMTRSQVLNILNDAKEQTMSAEGNVDLTPPSQDNKVPRKRRNSELYLSTSSSSEESSSSVAVSRRKMFRRSKNPFSKSEETTTSSHNECKEDSNRRGRRASLPHNFKIPAITITPSSPSIDPNHPNYPEFYEGKFYVESFNKYSSSQSIEDEVLENLKKEAEDLDSTPELDVIFQSAKSGVERQNCINFARSRKKKKQKDLQEQ